MKQKRLPFILAALWILFIIIQKIQQAAIALALRDSGKPAKTAFSLTGRISSLLLFILAAVNVFAAIRLLQPPESSGCCCSPEDPSKESGNSCCCC